MRLLEAKVKFNGREVTLNRQPDELKNCHYGDVLIVMFNHSQYPMCQTLVYMSTNTDQGVLNYRRISDPIRFNRWTHISNILLWGRKEVEDESVDR